MTQIIPTTLSLSFDNVIPLTPEAPLPIALTLDSWNRIALPEFAAIITSLLPSVNRASNKLSPSLIPIALIPFCLGLE